MVYCMAKRNLEVKHSHVTYHFLRNCILFIMDLVTNLYLARFFQNIRKIDLKLGLHNLEVQELYAMRPVWLLNHRTCQRHATNFAKQPWTNPNICNVLVACSLKQLYAAKLFGSFFLNTTFTVKIVVFMCEYCTIQRQFLRIQTSFC